ncbi:oligosaccharide flippase family protein [Accumulibacter sp.]|uniref:oligosaccharide flippase family protein n=1 Tax=Accumulibacter sp. TaxID=2053492 RepID=UPI0025E26E77|nr:oligosaccharide flippase family protein [Accumulibacter sp.]MCM8613609.1 oligosaccharide flippase family protein [Accumulibacter sp.]MCM8637363.1 oligosaccharide flippase family protein [Accumulibacter sp.]MCM8638969.1 oligosaccharide flippase family protein [Accumulibacter sp.]
MSDGLRQKILASSVYVVGRQILGIALSFLSLIVFYRYLTPAEFGIVAVAQGTWTFLGMIAVLGVDGYLIRLKALPDRSDLNALFSALIAVILLIYTGVFLSADLIAEFGNHADIGPVIRFVGISFIFKQFGLIGRTILEKEMRFRELSIIELVSQLAYYLVAIPWVMLGGSYWGIVAGTMVSTMITSIYTYAAHPLALQFRIDVQSLVINLKKSLSYQLTVCTWHLRDMLIPLILSRLGGVEVAGVVSAATQVVTKLTFFRSVIWRVSLSALANLQDDPERLCRAISKGVLYQVMFVGGILTFSAPLMPWIVPLLGEKWLGVLPIYPILALTVVTNSTFSMHVAALYGNGNNTQVNHFHIANVVTVIAITVFALPLLGTSGYLLGEILALFSYFILNRHVKTHFGTVSYGTAARLFAYSLPALLTPLVTSAPLAALAVLLTGLLTAADRNTRNAISASFSEVLGSLRKDK